MLHIISPLSLILLLSLYGQLIIIEYLLLCGTSGDQSAAPPREREIPLGLMKNTFVHKFNDPPNAAQQNILICSRVGQQHMFNNALTVGYIGLDILLNFAQLIGYFIKSVSTERTFID